MVIYWTITVNTWVNANMF